VHLLKELIKYHDVHIKFKVYNNIMIDLLMIFDQQAISHLLAINVFNL